MHIRYSKTLNYQTYIYIHIHIHTYTHTYIHIHTHTYIYTHIHTYTHTYIHIHTHTYIYTHIHTYTHTYIHIHTHDIYTNIHTYTQTYIHIHKHTYIYTNIHTYTQTYIHIHKHTYIYTYIDIHIHTHTNIHTYIYTNIHTYTHTYTYSLDELSLLKELKLKNVKRLMIGELNINSLANKFEHLNTFVGKYVDILILIETKLDSSFPSTQLLIDGYITPYRLDRNIHGGGGVLAYIRDDILCTQLFNHSYDRDIEGIVFEINLRKCKWLVFAGYNNAKNQIGDFL